MASLVGRRALPAPYSYRSDPRVPPFPDDRPIFIFDAYCVLCSRWVELVLRYDRAGRFRLLSAQSALGRALYVHYGLDPENYETNILLIDGVALIKAERDPSSSHRTDRELSRLARGPPASGRSGPRRDGSRLPESARREPVRLTRLLRKPAVNPAAPLT